jgi:hypothetical protein
VQIARRNGARNLAVIVEKADRRFALCGHGSLNPYFVEHYAKA